MHDSLVHKTAFTSISRSALGKRMSKARVAGQQTTITFVYMHTGAKHMLQLAEADEDGQLYAVTKAGA